MNSLDPTSGIGQRSTAVDWLCMFRGQLYECLTRRGGLLHE